MKTGIIDAGGGMRGIYASGVLDRCLDLGDAVHFDVAIGISAGSANLCSYLAGQRGRNYRFYTEYAFRKQYMSLNNFLRKGSYVDLDYAYSVLSNSGGEYPVDYPALAANPTELLVVATDAATGEAVYFDKGDISQDNYNVFKASSSIPFVSRPYPIGGKLYYDGALSDPIPLDKAFSLGCDRVVVVVTRPLSMVRKPGTDVKLARRIQRKYPHAAQALRQRAERYNVAIAYAKQLERLGRVRVIAPDNIVGMSTLKKDRAAMLRLYQKGLRDADRIKEFLRA